MPVYDYKCTARRPHKFERRKGYDDETIVCSTPTSTRGSDGPEYCEALAHRQIPGRDSNIGIIVN